MLKDFCRAPEGEEAWIGVSILPSPNLPNVREPGLAGKGFLNWITSDTRYYIPAHPAENHLAD